MIHGVELFFSLFNNLAIFIALVTLYGYLLRQLSQALWFKRQALFGFSFGMFAIGCMYAKIPVFEGVIVDQRNAIVVLSGAFGGPVSAIITAFITGSFRVYLGGIGAVAGVVGVTLSAIAGIILNKFSKKFESAPKAAMNSFFATLAILPGFLFVKDLQTGWELMKAMGLPYGLAIFCGIFLVGLLLKREEERYCVEQSLDESEERLDLALEGANEGLWDWDIEKNFLHFDSRYYSISGYEPDEFPATFEEWEKRLHPDDIDQTKLSVTQYLSGELKNYDVEFRFLRKTGDYMWIQGKGKIVHRNENGKPIRFIGTHSDITKRKQNEQALRFTQFSFDKAAIGIYYIRSDGRIWDVNEQAAKNLGYTMEKLSTMSIFDIDPLINNKNWEKTWKNLCKNGLDNYETIHKRKDGKKIPVEITSNLLEYNGSQFSIAFVLDITQRKQADNELKKLQNYLANIIDSMPSVLIGVDLDTHVTQWNNSAEKLTGISSANAEGQILTTVFPWIVPQRDKILKSIKSNAIKRIPKVPFEDEKRELRYEDITIYPLTANGVEGTVIRIDDVTEKVRMEETLIQNEKMLSVGGLAAGMAHEINNPLSGVIQNIDVLENRLTSGAIPANIKAAESQGTTMESISEFMNIRNIPHIIKSIKGSGLRMASIVENMLSFARKGDSSFSSHQPAELLDKILELAGTDYDLKKQYDFKTIIIEKEYAENLPMVACEGSKIQQVLLNLLNNGAHAMFARKKTKNTPPPKFILRLSHKTELDILQIEIEDNGVGMDEATKKKIFEPFFTTKPIGVGTGLGLSVSYFIITENHNGTMEVISEPGKRTNFIIRLPIERPTN